MARAFGEINVDTKMTAYATSTQKTQQNKVKKSVREKMRESSTTGTAVYNPGAGKIPLQGEKNKDKVKQNIEKEEKNWNGGLESGSKEELK